MRGRGVAAAVLDFLFPPACLGCAARLPPVHLGPEPVVCARCRTRLRPPPSPRCPRCDLPLGTGWVPSRGCGGCRDWDDQPESVRAAVVLEGPAARLVHALKYEGWERAAEPMADAMVGCLGPEDREGVLVPVPTTPRRMRRRGYNQASVLAREVGARAGIPVVEALGRKEEAASQVTLLASQRFRNVLGAFEAVAGAEGVSGRRVLLVDDVLTTGATAREAAGVLAGSGAASVSLLVFARALPGE